MYMKLVYTASILE